MSVKIMGAVWDMDLPPNEKLVLLALADHADHDGGNVFPSVPTVARKTGYSERQVQVIMRRLKDQGILVPVIVSKGGRKSSVYRIVLSGAVLTPLRKTSGESQFTAAVNPDSPQRCSFNTGAVNPSSPDPSYTDHLNRHGNHPLSTPPPSGEVGEGGVNPQQKTSVTQSQSGNTPPVPAAPPSPRKARKPRPADAVSDVIARGALGKDKGDKWTSTTAAVLIRDDFGATATPEQVAALADEVGRMYAWWAETKPNLNAPRQYSAVRGALAAYRKQARPVAAIPQPAPIVPEVSPEVAEGAKRGLEMLFGGKK
jgi:hypothetical protein